MTGSSQRKVPMQVLSFGPPRTATVSMQKALERLLEAPVYHGYIAADNMYVHLEIRRDITLLITPSPRGKFWLHPVLAKYEGKGSQHTRKDFDTGLGEYAATTDTPTCFLWRELMDAYPEAKVVLVNRGIYMT